VIAPFTEPEPLASYDPEAFWQPGAARAISASLRNTSIAVLKAAPYNMLAFIFCMKSPVTDTPCHIIMMTNLVEYTPTSRAMYEVFLRRLCKDTSAIAIAHAAYGHRVHMPIPDGLSAEANLAFAEAMQRQHEREPLEGAQRMIHFSFETTRFTEMFYADISDTYAIGDWIDLKTLVGPRISAMGAFTGFLKHHTNNAS